MATKEKEPIVATHGVFYTDGGCRPSRGIGGYGVHGYTYIEEPAKVGTGCKDALPSKNGYIMDKTGIPEITLIDYVDAVGSLIPESTNNIAELTALLKTFEVIKHFKLKEALILMDSNYVRDGIEGHLERWESNGWIKADGGPVANEELWRALSHARKELEAQGTQLRFGWVKGHSGNLGNELADRWATKGIMAGKNDIKIDTVLYRPAKGYWTAKTETNRLFCQPNWYFNSKIVDKNPETGYHTYYLGEPREDDELLGKKMVDASFCVLQMKEEEPILEKIRKAHAETDFMQYGNPVLGRLNKILSKDVYEDILRFEDHFIRRDFHNGMLFAVGSADPMGVQLTRELRPPRLAFSAMDSLYALENILNHHVNGNKGTHQVSTEITALLYETAHVGKKDVFRLKSSITTADKTLQVTASYEKSDRSLGEASFDLTLGHDLPDRNTLAAIADQEPKVYVVTWPESPVAIRYATVIETNTGRGVWAALYSNLHLLPQSPAGNTK